MNNILGGLGGGILGKLGGGAGKFNVTSLQSMLASINGQSNGQKFENYFYTYRVQTFQILIDGDPEPTNITGEALQKVIITRLYDEAIHPIMEVVANLPPKIHKKIKDNKQDLKVRLRIKKCLKNKSGDVQREEDYINSTFGVIMDDEADFKDEDAYDEANKATVGSTADKHVYNQSDYATEYTLSLWEKDKVDAMRSVVNMVVENATVSTALKKIYADSGINKILISPLDNKKSYSEIRIKPMNLMNIPAYIDKIYGTYYTGSCVFADYRCLYFLSKNGVCDAKEDGEYTRTIFKIPKSTSSKKNSRGTTKDTTNLFYYMYLDEDSVEFESPSNTQDATEGNNFTIVDPSKKETTDVEGAGNQSGKGNARVVEDNYSNEYNKSTMISDVIETSKVATIHCTDYDEDCVTPNKEFVILFDDSKMKDKNGFYRIIESQTILTKSKAGLDIVGTHKLAFKSAISTGDADNKVGTASMRQTTAPTPTKKSSPSGDKVKTSGQSEFKPATPKPRLSQVDSTQVNVTGVEKSPVQKNPDYQYDDLGNLKGVDVPEYNKILDTDSTSVVNAKMKAQEKMLPSKGPQPRINQ